MEINECSEISTSDWWERVGSGDVGSEGPPKLDIWGLAESWPQNGRFSQNPTTMVHCHVVGTSWHIQFERTMMILQLVEAL